MLPHGNCYEVPGYPLVAGEYPFSINVEKGRDRLLAVLQSGITCFVDLTMAEDGLHPYEPALLELARSLDRPVRRVHVPVRDMEPPSVQTMHELRQVIRDAATRGERVYLHCWGGVGRTGSVVGCLLAEHGLTGDQAVERVEALFKTVTPEKWSKHGSSFNTAAQREFVRNWHAELERDRVRGSLVGLAVGDALGTTVEFHKPGSFAPVTDMVGGGPFRLQPGEWTDDTSMALCLAESLITCNGHDARDQMTRYVRWAREGYMSSNGSCFDVGKTVSGSIERFLRTGDPEAGPSHPSTSGNGSIMRLAPVAMFYRHDFAQAIEMCAASSRTTHGSAIAIDACRYLGALLVGALRGAPRDQLLAPFFSLEPGYWEARPLVPEIAEIAAGSFLTRQPPEIKGSGYAAQSLEAALWAFCRTADFRAGCLAAVNLGNDADTTAAVFGQIAGACYGEHAIPREWRLKLARRDLIDRLADALWRKGEDAGPRG